MALSVPAEGTRSIGSSAHFGCCDRSNFRTSSASVSTSFSCIRAWATSPQSSNRTRPDPMDIEKRVCSRALTCAHGERMTDRDMADLHAYYARDEEDDRLTRGVGRVEFERTLEVVARTLPPPPATVADIGGGPGRYTDWLLERGYSVVHRDLVASHVERVA